MKYTDEQLSAYLDGELPDKLMSEIETELAKNHQLAEHLTALAAANQAVQAAFGSIADEPIPAHILELLNEPSTTEHISLTANVVPFRQRLAAFSVSKWAAPLAASLAMMLGVTLGRGTMLASNNNDTMYAQLSGTITTSSPLYDVLNSRPSAVQVSLGKHDDINIKPTLSFQTVDGSYCREFQAQSKTSALRGVACKDNQAWKILLLNQTKISESGGYQTASGTASALVDQLIDEIIVGDPLGSEAEGLIISRGWNQD